MSKATEAVDKAMFAHEDSKHARQVANSANANANDKFAKSEKDLKDAIDALNAEVVQMAEDAKQTLPDPPAPTPDSALPPPRPKEDVVSDSAPVITPTLPA